jgi:hypothetical protein
MRYISAYTLQALLEDDFMKQCCLCGNKPVQFHHNLIYARSQVDDAWTILPLCHKCHPIEKRKDIREKLDWMMLNRGSEAQLKQYSKVNNLITKRDELNKKFGTFSGKV